MSEHLPPVDLIPADDDEDATSVQNGADPARLHAWLRTIAALVAALALLWMASGVGGIRDANERQACFIELQQGMFGGPSLRPEEEEQQETATQLVERAEECGLPVMADALRRQYDLDEE